MGLGTQPGARDRTVTVPARRRDGDRTRSWGPAPQAAVPGCATVVPSVTHTRPRSLAGSETRRPRLRLGSDHQPAPGGVTDRRDRRTVLDPGPGTRGGGNPVTGPSRAENLNLSHDG
eukprot:765246-Hanusia_phi.AAC.1